MNLEDKVKELENLKYKIKQTLFKIKDLKETYLPSKQTSVFTSHSNRSSSPQEIIILKIDELERELGKLQTSAMKVNDEIYSILEKITDPKARWIVTQRIKGKAWQEIECNNFSITHMKHIYRKTINTLYGEINE